MSDPQPAPEVDQDEFHRAWEAGAMVLDVRNPDEHADKRVPGVTLIPLPELADRVAEVPAGRPLYVICAVGGRSMKAATFLRDQHGIDAVNVAGGTNAWAEAGRPLDHG